MTKPESTVMADGRQLDTATITDSYIKAVNINRNIIVNAQAAQMSLYEVCKGLKEMRDGKLYKELGYQNFEGYCEKETGIKYSTAYKYIKIVETLNIENLSPAKGFGVEKLYLLTTLSDEERTELTENTDLESVSKRELEEKVKEIKALREKSEEQNNYINALVKQNSEKSEELYNLARQREELERQLEELENRPIDVAISESDSREIENLKKAMKICDNQWAEKYSELEEENIKFTRQLHQDYKAQIDKLTEDYEKKLAEIPKSVPTEQTAVPDMKETFKAYYSMAYNSFDLLVGFAKKQSEKDKVFCLEKAEKLINTLKSSIQEV